MVRPLIRQATRSQRSKVYGKRSAQVDEARWRQKMRDSRVLVAVIDRQPVGFISAIGSDIDLLFVAPERARQGIAGALLAELFRQIPQGTLTVEASITARACFARHGFTVVEEQRVAARGETFRRDRRNSW